MAGHPGKAAVLGVLFVVALWFWIPLAWRWTRPDDVAANTLLYVETGHGRTGHRASPTPTAEAGVSLRKAEGSGPTWHQLTQWMDDDPRTKPTNPLRDHRDPFLVAQTEPVKAEPETVVEEVKAAPATNAARPGNGALRHHHRAEPPGGADQR